MNLSEHLSLDEFTHSDTANAKGIDNSLPDELLETAKYTANNLFEPIRELLGGVSIKINSGFRCVELNTAVRGVATSQHVKAQAIDMFPRNMTVQDAFEEIRNSNLVWDQLILEHDSRGTIWIHASIVDGKNRQQVIPSLLKQND
jgi:zinc D-Ala-D-Ala carboxypeptidase